MSDLDWSMEGRADVGRAIIDIAPGHDDHECYTGWYARQLGIASHDHYHTDHWLRPLLDKMTTAGVLVKTGGQYQCDGTDPYGQRCDRMHQEACYYRLACDRSEARERWDEHTRQPRWWTLTPRAASTGPSFAERQSQERIAEMRAGLNRLGLGRPA